MPHHRKPTNTAKRSRVLSNFLFIGSSFAFSSSPSTNTSRNSRYFIGATAAGFYINPGLCQSVYYIMKQPVPRSCSRMSGKGRSTIPARSWWKSRKPSSIRLMLAPLYATLYGVRLTSRYSISCHSKDRGNNNEDLKHKVVVLHRYDL